MSCTDVTITAIQYDYEQERSRRCKVSDGKDKLKRCGLDCKSCEKMKDGAPLSLETFFEETELEFEDTDANQYETILTVMLFEDLLKGYISKHQI